MSIQRPRGLSEQEVQERLTTFSQVGGVPGVGSLQAQEATVRPSPFQAQVSRKILTQAVNKVAVRQALSVTPAGTAGA